VRWNTYRPGKLLQAALTAAYSSHPGDLPTSGAMRVQGARHPGCDLRSPSRLRRETLRARPAAGRGADDGVL